MKTVSFDLSQNRVYLLPIGEERLDSAHLNKIRFQERIRKMETLLSPLFKERIKGTRSSAQDISLPATSHNIMTSSLAATLSNAAKVIEYVPLSQLVENHRYLVYEMRTAQTRYGRYVIATLLKPDNEPVYVFLPRRVSSVLSDETVSTISPNSKLYLVYLGKVNTANAMRFESDDD